MTINSLSQLPPLTAPIGDKSPVGQASGEFGNLLETILNKVNAMQQNGEEAIT
jgi:flagellar hook-basal body complex protein FliE